MTYVEDEALTDSPHAIRARALKASALVAFLEVHFAEGALDKAETATEDEWATWAEKAGVLVPSARCRVLVRNSLHRRANPPKDPFAGL